MSSIKITNSAAKEEKLDQFMDYLEELKDVFADIVEEYEKKRAPEETVDELTSALDCLEDAHDIILDVLMENDGL